MQILNIDGLYFVPSFKSLGHDVLSIGPLAGCDVVLNEVISLVKLLKILESHKFTPDLIVWADLCKPPSVLGFETLSAITVGYSIDQYCNPWHAPYSAAFDLILVAQRDYLHLFDDPAIQNIVEWSPLFCRTEQDKDHGKQRSTPVSFVGTIDGRINRKRKQFLDAFTALHPLVVTQGDYVPIYNDSQIVLNQSAAGELNFRMFEAMACGAAVLTEDTGNGLHELFSNGTNILLYPRGNAQAAALIAGKALASPEALREVATNGRNLVQAKHSSRARATHIITQAEAIADGSPTWRQANSATVEAHMANAYTMLAVDEALPLTGELRNFYTTIAQKTLQSIK